VRVPTIALATGLLAVAGCDGGFPCAEELLDLRADDLGPVTETAYVCAGELVDAGFCLDSQYAYVDPYAGTGCPGTLIRIGRASAIGGLYLSIYLHRDLDGAIVSVTAQFEGLTDETDEETRIWSGAQGWIALEQAGPEPGDRFAGHFEVTAGDRGSVTGTFDTSLALQAPSTRTLVLE
jgi:hypothetical protein